MKKNKIIYFSSLILFVAVVVQSCAKEKDLDRLKDKWNPTIAAPLINAELGVYDILAHEDSSDLIVIDPSSGLLALVYQGQLFSYEAKDLIYLPDQGREDFIGLNATEIATYNTNNSVTKTQNSTYQYVSSTDVQIDSLRLKTGNLVLTINSNFITTGSLNIKFPGMIKNGSALQLSFPLSGTPSINVENIDLSAYMCQMSTGPGNFNEIPIEFTLTFNGGPAPTPLQSVSITTALTNWTFDRFRGYIGEQTVGSALDSVQLRIFNNSSGGYFELTNPKAKMIIDNSFGFPVNMELTTLKSRNEITGVETPILLSNFQNPFPISHPSTFGEIVQTNKEVNKSNSNVGKLVTPTPKYFTFGLDAHANPDGLPPQNARNFMSDKSRINIRTEVELPLEGFAYGFSIIDTLDFSFAENRDEIEWIMFRFNVENGFPIDLKMQLIWLDEHHRKLDSLLTLNENVVPSGKISSSGKVNEPSQKITDVMYEKERVKKIIKAKYVIVKGETNSLNASSSNSTNPVVKIYEDYKLNVRVGVKVNTKPGKSL